MKSASVFALLLLVGATSMAVNAEVVPLTDATYAHKLKDQPDTLWFINFYTPWCPWSQRLAPAWEQLGIALQGETRVQVGSVDCDTNKATCTKAAIRGYPTLKVFYNGMSDQYYGVRDLESLKAFVLQEHVHQLASAKAAKINDESVDASEDHSVVLKLKKLFGWIDSWIDSLDAFSSRV